jgi:hypothetical protein
MVCRYDTAMNANSTATTLAAPSTVSSSSIYLCAPTNTQTGAPDATAEYVRPRGRQRSRAATTQREKLSLGSDVGSCRRMHLSVDDSLINGPRSETLQFLYYSLGLELDNTFTDDPPSLISENTKRQLKDCKVSKDRVDSVRSCDGSMDQCGSATRRLIRLFDTEAGNDLATRDGMASFYRI